MGLLPVCYNGELAYVSYTPRQLCALRSVSLRQVVENLAKTRIGGKRIILQTIFVNLYSPA